MNDKQLPPYIRRREDGMLCFGNTKVFLDGVIAAYERGETPESIVESWPAITVEQARGAIEYYLAHKEAIGEYMRHNDEEFGRLRAENMTTNRALRERLLAFQREQNRAESK